MGKRREQAAGATIGDVASVAGVSVATVSRALRGLPNVSPDTRHTSPTPPPSSGTNPIPTRRASPPGAPTQ